MPTHDPDTYLLSFVRDAGDLASAAELRGVSRAELGRAVRAAQRRVAQDQADDAAGLAAAARSSRRSNNRPGPAMDVLSDHTRRAGVPSLLEDLRSALGR